jgi:hypothetical protein
MARTSIRDRLALQAGHVVERCHQAVLQRDGLGLQQGQRPVIVLIERRIDDVEHDRLVAEGDGIQIVQQ